MLKVEVIHHVVLDSCDAIYVDNDVVIVEEVEGVDDVVKFIV